MFKCLVTVFITSTECMSKIATYWWLIRLLKIWQRLNTVFGNDTTKPNFVHEEIMNILNLGNASSQLVQDLFFSFAN